MRKVIYVFIVSIFLTIVLPLTAAHAQVGALDPTFGSGGIVTTDFGSFEDQGFSTAIQSDGKIVVAGFSNNGSDHDFALVRYNSDGSLDNDFAADGKVTTAIGNSNDQGYSVVIQEDSKIVVAGESLNFPFSEFALVRYNSNGSLDNTFGSEGKVITDIGVYSSYAKSAVLQSDGKIVIAGYCNNGGHYDFALIRYNSNGSLDTTFGYYGKVTTDFAGNGFYDDMGYSVAIQTDGKILVGGTSYDDGSGDNDFALVRYNSNGSLDNNFGLGGKVTTDLITGAGSGTWDQGGSIAIQGDGRIVLGGYSYGGDYSSFADFVLVRYNSNGSLDNTFSFNGKATTDFLSDSWDEGYSVSIAGDDKIVVAGYTYTDYPLNALFALSRYNSDGSLDSNFGFDGKVTTDIGSNLDKGYSVAIQDDGKIVVAGYSDFDFAVARYNVESAVAIPEITLEHPISLSPNPFSNELLIEGTKENGVITLVDITGKEVLRQKTLNSITKINTEDLLPGFYLLNYKAGNETKNISGIKF